MKALRGKHLREAEYREAESSLRKISQELFRKKWSLRRMLDFTRPYRIPQKWWRSLPLLTRERRASIAARLRQASKELPDEIAAELGKPLGLTAAMYRDLWIEHAVSIAPAIGRPRLRSIRRIKRGRPAVYDSKFVEEVNAWETTLKAMRYQKGP